MTASGGGWSKQGRGARASASAGEAKGDRTTTLMQPVGQGRLHALMVSSARRLRLHHGILVAGRRGTGLSTVARWLAAAVLCPSDIDQEEPFGTCRTCRLVAAGEHPDLHVLTRPEDKTRILIDDTRELVDKLGLHAYEGRARVALVDSADDLPEDCQQTLLKTLEEPGSNTFLIVVASRPDQLLPTVLSRVQRLNVLPLGQSDLLKLLRRKNSESISRHEHAVQQSGGSYRRAVDSLTEHSVQLQDLVEQLLDDHDGLRPVEVTRAVLATAASKSEARQAVVSFLSALRRTCVLRIRPIEQLSTGSYGPPESEPWASISELTLVAERDLLLQIPADQVLCGMLVEWSRLLRSGS